MSVPAMHSTSVTAVLAFTGAYSVLNSHWPERKRRAWLVTAMAACIASIGSLPFVYDFAWARGDVSVLEVDAQSWRQAWAMNICAMFQGYLTADLIVGVFHYREEINILTGFIHHVVYMSLMQFILTTKPEWAPIFCLVLVMELPTFILGVARLFPGLRNDRVFSGAFLATRILLHVFLLGTYLRRKEWGPTAWLCGAFPLHAMWFIKQLIGGNKTKVSSSATSRQPIEESEEYDVDDARALQSPPPELVDSTGTTPASTEPTTPEADRADPMLFVPASKQSYSVELHLLRHALTSEEPLRIRALLAAASRGRYAALAARAKGLYRDAQTYAPAWRENVRNRVWGASEGALRREVLAN